MATKMSEPRFIVGIDLGTSNCAAAFAEIKSSGPADIHDFPILQAERPGATAKNVLLPSALYFPMPEERTAGSLDLPWPSGDYVVGQFARWRGARVPGRLITSAKSWLCHAGVDRTATILPWAAPAEVKKISPVEASARLLEQIRNAWDHEHPDAPLASQEVVVTVPASFDEVARGLTVDAAKMAGFEHFTLLEEPQAAFYHFTYKHAPALERLLSNIQLVLVVDVGGGTTDLTLVRVANSSAGPVLKRIAVGEHLILGGDNMDNAVARRIEEKLVSQNKKLSAAQWLQLVQAARESKETLLARKAPEQSNISLAAEGSKLFGSTLSSSITRQELESLVLDGFLPVTRSHDLPRRARTAIQELGLPYEPEPAITKHIAAFLLKHAAAGFEALGMEPVQGALPRPDAILLNGGVFNSDQIARRLHEVLSSWWPERPRITLLEHESLDLAVSRGAAHYGRVRRGFGRKIGGGLAHAFFVAVGDKSGQPDANAVCLIPRGLEEGDTVELKDRVFKLQVGRPVQFPIYSTTADRVERPGEIVSLSEDLQPLPPIHTVLRSGKERVERIPVYLRGRLTEIGTVELWCAAAESREQWRLEFAVRGAAPSEKLLTTESLPANYGEARHWVDLIYGAKPKPQPGSPGPKDAKQLWNFLERTLGPREKWSPALLRQLWTDLFANTGRRRRSPSHERIFLQLLGYTLRPGFGAPLDEWRSDQTFKLFTDQVEFHREKPNWNEFWILWRRISGGLTAAHQAELWENLKPHLAGRIPLAVPKQYSKPKGPQPEGTDEMVRTAASLEHLPPPEKAWLGEQICTRLRESGPVGGPWTWSLGRLGARVPFYGSLHNVLPPDTVETWIRLLLELGLSKLDGAPFAVTQLSRMTGDRNRDIDDGLRKEVLQSLRSVNISAAWLQIITEPTSLEREDEARALGDSLPIGLQLAHPGVGNPDSAKSP